MSIIHFTRVLFLMTTREAMEFKLSGNLERIESEVKRMTRYDPQIGGHDRNDQKKKQKFRARHHHYS